MTGSGGRADRGVRDFVLGALPPPPARVLEVGAGGGELAADLGAGGYDVLAIDPAATDGPVVPVALLDLEAPPASFDAAVAVVSLHHVEPLEPSCAQLAALVRPGGTLVVDEFDVAAFDEPAAEWLCERWRELGREAPDDPAAMVGDLRDHLHPVERIRAVLSPAFGLGPATRGAYLHRWQLTPDFRSPEDEAIAAGTIPAVGVRFTGVRR
jgi:SAM-dependent methyltransferase